MTLLPQAVYRFSAIPIKLPIVFFTQLEQKKKVLICVETQKTLNGQSNSEKEKTELEESGSLTSDYTAKLQSSKQHGTDWHRNGNIDQWNRTDSPKIKLCSSCWLICGKGVKTIQWRKYSLFNKWCWENWKARYI